MGQFLLNYHRPEPATWVYLSSFLVIGLYFMFHRLWSIRNLDILLLILLAPGLMMVYEGRRQALDLSRPARLQINNFAAKAPHATTRLQTVPNRLPATNASSPARIDIAAISRIPFSDAAQLSGTNVDPVTDSRVTDQRSTSKEMDLRSASTPKEFQSAPTPEESQTTSKQRELQTASNQNGLQSTSKQNELRPIKLVRFTNAQNAAAQEVNSPGTQLNEGPWPSRRIEFWGFVWLLSVCLLLLIRLLLDTTMVRRPLLEPNLSSGGLTFIGVSLFLFLMANIVTSTAEDQNRQGPKPGPGYVLLNMLPDIATIPDADSTDVHRAGGHATRSAFTLQNLARLVSILANLAIVMGMVLIGYFHFDNAKTGIGAATLFLLMPYAAQMSGRTDHVLPGAFLIWAVLTYRLPTLSGMMIGFAAGLVYYPFFLLPLWLSFYWQHGLKRFFIGFSISLVVLMMLLLIGPEGLIHHLRQMFGAVRPAMQNLQGIWGLGWHPYFRIPVIVVFVLMSLSFIFWPAQKNLGTLMSCSAAIMVGAQFWHGYGGGLFMAWFLPLVMLTIFRPNLDNRIALEVVRRVRRKRPATRPPNETASPTIAATMGKATRWNYR